MNRCLLNLVILGLFYWLSSSLWAFPQDDVERNFELKSMLNTYRNVYKSYERAKSLEQQGLISKSELDKATIDLENARLDLERAVYRRTGTRSEFDVMTVVKSFNPATQETHLRVQLKAIGITGHELEFLKLNPEEEQLLKALMDVRIRDVFVSVLSGDVIVSLPMRLRIPEMPSGQQTKEISFKLLKDVDDVTILIEWRGQKMSYRMIPETDPSSPAIRVTVYQNSLIAKPGETCKFKLRLEKFSSQVMRLSAKTLKLPEGFASYLEDETSKNRLTSFTFDKEQRSRDLLLCIDIPFSLHGAALPEVIPFDLSIEVNGKKTFNQSMEILPRGLGNIMLQAQDYFLQLKPGMEGTFVLELRNSGSARLQDLTIEVVSNFEGQKKISPTQIPSLEPDKRETIHLTVSTPKDSDKESIYVLQIRAIGQSEGKRIEGEMMELKVRVVPDNPNTGLLGWLAGGLLLIAILSIFLIRRAARR